MSKIVEKNILLGDIIQKSLDIIQLYGLNKAKLVVEVNTDMASGNIFLTYTQKENEEKITISRKIS